LRDSEDEKAHCPTATGCPWRGPHEAGFAGYSGGWRSEHGDTQTDSHSFLRLTAPLCVWGWARQARHNPRSTARSGRGPGVWITHPRRSTAVVRVFRPTSMPIDPRRPPLLRLGALPAPGQAPAPGEPGRAGKRSSIGTGSNGVPSEPSWLPSGGHARRYVTERARGGHPWSRTLGSPSLGSFAGQNPWPRPGSKAEARVNHMGRTRLAAGTFGNKGGLRDQEAGLRRY
jgi:hypothetical protein